MGKFETFVKNTGSKTSEELLGFNSQLPDQCPLLDEIIQAFETEAKNIKDVERNLKDVEEAADQIGDLDWADYNLRNLSGEVEKVRENIIALRTWGQEWKDLAKRLVEYVPRISKPQDLIDIKNGYEPSEDPELSGYRVLAATSGTLHLNLKKKWYDLIESGEKKEEYREVKPYWATRIENFNKNGNGLICFKNGYSKQARGMIVECKGVDLGFCDTKPEWGQPNETHYILKLGKVLWKSV